MAKAGDKGIPLEDYIKVAARAARARQARPRTSCVTLGLTPTAMSARATMVARSRRRVGGQQIRPRSIASGVRCGGMPLWFRPSSRCFSSRCTPSRQRLSTRRKKLPAGGVPVRHRWFWKRQNGDCKAAIERSTYSEAVNNFLAELSDWLRETHPEARPMAAKTIGDHLRANANVQALLPEAWLRRK